MKKNADRIQALRDAGYKVRVRQLRRFQAGVSEGALAPKHALKAGGNAPLSHGGKTQVTVFDPKIDRVIAEGVAYCNPKDPFNHKLGMTIALNRLERQLANG